MTAIEHVRHRLAYALLVCGASVVLVYFMHSLGAPTALLELGFLAVGVVGVYGVAGSRDAASRPGVLLQFTSHRSSRLQIRRVALLLGVLAPIVVVTNLSARTGLQEVTAQSALGSLVIGVLREPMDPSFLALGMCGVLGLLLVAQIAEGSDRHLLGMRNFGTTASSATTTLLLSDAEETIRIVTDNLGPLTYGRPVLDALCSAISRGVRVHVALCDREIHPETRKELQGARFGIAKNIEFYVPPEPLGPSQHLLHFVLVDEVGARIESWHPAHEPDRAHARIFFYNQLLGDRKLRAFETTTQPWEKVSISDIPKQPTEA